MAPEKINIFPGLIPRWKTPEFDHPKWRKEQLRSPGLQLPRSPDYGKYRIVTNDHLVGGLNPSEKY